MATISHMSRRAFLKTVGTVALSAGVSSSLIGCQAVGSPTAGEDDAVLAAATHLLTYWGGWTPTQSMERSDDNPTPHDKLIEVLDAYMAQNPTVEVEWIRVPAGAGEREWAITQQTAGTIPHIVTQATWYVKDDLDKNWWVDLTPYLDQPNPYIADGATGSERWLDQFYPIPTGEALMGGKYYNLLYGLITTFFYYNVDWFKQVGVEPPETYAEFLAVCQAFKDEGVNAYGGWTGRVSDTDHWYRIQLGGMLIAKDVEPQVNPDRNTATFEEVACAIKTGVYSPNLPQYRAWLELWKQNVQYRTPDWPVQATDSHSNFLNKVEPIMENGTWSLPRLLTDPLIDFEWSAFYAPTLTNESSEFVTDPPTPAWPIGGAVGDQFAIPTRASADGVLESVIDLMRWITVPDNLHTIQSEIGTTIPNVKDVPIDPRFQSSYEKLTSQIGETQMFAYEEAKMDAESATAIGEAWRGYLLDQLELDDAIATIDEAFLAYADRYIEKTGLVCG